ncbi:MAG: radical SAM protein, partial [Syntrophales bacterium]
ADRINDDIADILHQTGIESVSIAPEAGSQRLRNVINKGLTEEDILEAAEVLAAHDILNLRLYFLVGLPTETDEDVMEIVNLVKGLQHNIRRRWKGARRFHRIMLSINQFIPKAATPFQWHPLEDIRIVRKRIQEIEVTFRHDSTVRVIHDVAKWNYLQALLSLGDRRVGSILLAAHRLGGNWPRAYREVPINPDFFVYRMKGADEIFPWDFIDHGVSKSLLLKEYERALT